MIIIGGGSAGFSVIQELQGKKLKVALVENRQLGGSCPNFACVPTKALVKCASVLDTLNHARDFGILCKGTGFDWRMVQKYRADRVSMTKAQDAKNELRKQRIDLIWGTASFLNPQEIAVGKKVYRGDQFAVTTGSRERLPEVAGTRTAGLLNSDQLIEVRDLPKSLSIIGGGPVGIEFAQIFARFGVEVTILTKNSEVLVREEPEVAKLARQHLSKDGVRFVLDSEITSFNNIGRMKQIHFKRNGKIRRMEANQILVAMGRVANLDKLHLEFAGVKLTEKGIKTNRYLRTSQPHIYAAGDVVGNMLFTHVASYEGSIVGQNLLGRKIRVSYDIIPRGTFCDPEIGSVGITEKEAKAEGRKIMTAVLPYGGGRGFIHADPEGLIKVVVDKTKRTILGGSVIGKGAVEFIHLLAIAMHGQLTADDLSRMVYAFPSHVEALAGITAILKY